MYYQKYPKYRPKLIDPNNPLSINILRIIGAGLAITAASLLSPTFLANLLYAYVRYKLHQPVTKNQVYKSLKYLERKKFIAYPADNRERRVRLTKLGEKRLSKVAYENLTIKNVAWDGLWRFVTFDIPEDQQALRYIFRRKLKQLGFFHFQLSVFLLPYPCEKEIKQMTEYLNITKYVHVIPAKRFPTDKPLLRKFNLLP